MKRERAHFQMVPQNMQQNTDQCMCLGVHLDFRIRNILKYEKKEQLKVSQCQEG